MAQLHIYTGDGKGKTTAALGLAIRVAGAGQRVGIIYFDKGGDDYHERKILDQIDNIDYRVTGLDRKQEDGGFRMGVTDEDRAEGKQGLQMAEEMAKNGEYDLLVLDEAVVSASLGIVLPEELIAFLDKYQGRLEIALTGRKATAELIERADLVSEIKPIKHYFTNGVGARPGIEY